MKKTTKLHGFLPSLILMCAIVLIFGQIASAQVVTFAQFLERNGTQDFVFTNNAGASGTFSNVAGGSPIFFVYQNVSNLPAELQGFQNARMFISTTTTTPATLTGSNLTQPLDAVSVVQIIRETPTSPGVGTGSRTNLLTATFSSAAGFPTVSGNSGGNSATLSAATPNNNVTFSSDFIGFGLTTQRDLALSFSSVISSYASGAGGFLQSFTAAGTGTFSSNPPPSYFVPTAAPATVSGRVTNVFGNGIGRAVVTMTDGNGDIRQETTNHFGRFTFSDVSVGETYIFDVQAKSYSFSPQVINVDESIRNLEFTQGLFW